jgi:membrane protein
MRIKTLWDVTLGAARDWWEDNGLRLAASLAYYTALSLAPLLLLMVGLLGLVLGREQVARQLAVQLESLMGPAGREGKKAILAKSHRIHILVRQTKYVACPRGAFLRRKEHRRGRDGGGAQIL